jgi:hypothetical protein
LQQHARTVAELACSPVKIGVMGEFSSSKTLLIGSLIGYADALPVSETPTTGNITAVHLCQSSELHTTRIARLRVEYLSEQKVKECLRYMLKEAEVRAKSAELTSREISLLPSLYPTTIVSSNGILSWCERAWNQAQSLELRSLLRELVTFVRTYSSYGREICGKSYQIDLGTAKKGLRLAALPMNILELRPLHW